MRFRHARELARGSAYSGPAILLVMLIFAYPLFNVLLYAFRREGKFVGIANFQALLNDSVFYASLRNNFKLLLLVPLILFISLVIAVVINEKPRGWKFHRFAILIPFVLPIPVSAIAIAAIVAYRGGLNLIFTNIGLDFLVIDWLGSGESAFFIISFALIWREIGFCALLIFSRLGNIDDEVVEACQLDGAGWWKRLRHAILPQISGVLLTVAVLEIITVFFYTFEWVYVLTRGGPAGTTMVVDLYIFQQAIQFRSIGIATAASTSVLIIMLVVFLIYKLILAAKVRRQSQSFNIAFNSPTSHRFVKSKPIAKNMKPKSLLVQKISAKFIMFLRQGVLWFFTLTFCIPLYFMFVNAFKTTIEYGNNPWNFPLHPTLRAFQEVFQRGEIAIWFRNSVVVSFGSVLLITFTGILVSYYSSTGPIFAKKYFRKFFIPLLAIPPIIIIIPLFVLFSNLGLVNTFLGAIVVFSGLLLPFSCYLFLGFFDTFPREILEAAAVDGASKLKTLTRVILPSAKPVIATQFVINLLYVWNSLLIVLIFLQGNDRRTLAAGISVFQGHFFRDTPLVMAASILVVLPMFIAYLFSQRLFRTGLLVGAVK